MIVGLTGGIGSGKSTVAKLFEIFGCPVFNSDEAAKKVYFETEVKAAVIALLGAEAYLPDSALNKSFISKKIFSDTQLLHALNAIIHPAVGKSFETFKKLHAGKIIIKESALLFEANIDGGMDKIIIVAANDELRIKRVMERDGLSREQVLEKLKSQMPQEEKIKRSHFVVYNNETEFIITQVIEIYQVLKGNVL